MMKIAPIMIAVAVLTTAVGLAQGRPKAEVSPLLDADGAHAGSTVRVALQVSLPEGLHVQSDKPRDPMLIPTVLTIEPPAGVRLGEIAYPESTDFAQAGQKEPLAVFAQRFVVGAKLTLDGSLPPGDIVVPARFRYQACDASTCFAPTREETRWTIQIVPAATPTPARSAEIFEKIHFRR